MTQPTIEGIAVENVPINKVLNRAQATEIAKYEMLKWGLPDWTLHWNIDRQFLGTCHFREKQIWISQLILKQAPMEFLDTVRHEIAHALVGPGHGHDSIWMQAAAKVGATNSATCRVSLQTDTSIGKEVLNIAKFENLRPKKKRDAFWDLLRPYQKEAVEFLEKSNFRALLGHDPGLGKTIMLLMAARYNREELTPCLIILKSSLKYQWAAEIQKWLAPEPDYKGKPTLANFPQIIEQGPIIPGFQFYIISMSMLHKYEQEILTMGFKMIALDESHKFNNDGAKRTKALMNICAVTDKIIPLSGSPIKNRAAEYFNTLHILDPNEWYSKKNFIRNWVEDVLVNGKWQKGPLRRDRKEEFFRRTEDYILHVNKRDVLKDLPPVSRDVRILEITENTFKKSYNEELMKLKKYVDKKREEAGFDMEVLAYLQRMRHITGAAKVASVADEIIDFLEANEDEKILIGTHHDAVSNFLHNFLSKYDPMDIRGGIADEKRDKVQKLFNNDPSKRVLIAKILAAGEGLNLQHSCSYGIILERMWNAWDELQFEGRLDRFGQKNPVQFTYYIAKGTIDEFMTELVDRKKSYTDSATIEEVKEHHKHLDYAEIADRLIQMGELK